MKEQSTKQQKIIMGIRVRFEDNDKSRKKENKEKEN